MRISGPESFESRLVSPGSPFELSAAETAGNGGRLFRHAPPTLTDLYRKAAVRGHAPLLIAGDIPLQCDRLFSRALILAAGLQDRFRLGAGRRVGIALGNSVETVLSIIATTLLGATAVLIGEQPDERRKYCIDLAGCDVLIVPRSSDGAIHAHTIAPTPVKGETDVEFCSLLQGAPLEHSSIPVLHPDHEALIAFTSGTTGTPKGVILTHRGIVTGLMNMMLASSLGSARTKPIAPRPSAPSRPSCLLLSPLSHVSGYTQLFLQMMLAGSLVIGVSDDMPTIAMAVEKHKVRSVIGLSPAMMHGLLRQAETYDLSSLSSFFVNGYAVHANLIAQVKRILPNVAISTSYGMTETNGAICSLSGEKLEINPSSVGRVVPSAQLEFRDERGGKLAANGPGEIWLRGAMLMQGYLGARTGLDSGGWFRTGDIGRLDKNGYLVILDRQTDTTVIQGRTILCIDAERLANTWAGVEDAAVVTPQNEDCEFLRIAYVTGDKNFAVSNFEDRMSQKLGVPVTAFRIAEIPRKPSGKIDQSRLNIAIARHKPSSKILVVL